MYYVSDNDWSSSHNYDYWNINFTSAASVNNTDVIKTIYDPSISSFTIPKTAAFSNFSAVSGYTSNSSNFNVSGSFNKGWNFYKDGWKSGGTIFIASFGYIKTQTSNKVFVNVQGDYWNNGANSTSSAYCMCFDSGYISCQTTNGRSNGFSLRLVLE